MARYNCPICQKPCENPQGCFVHKPKKGLNKSGKKLGRRKLTEEEKMEKQQGIDKMWTLFLEVFKERGPYSEIDGTYLGSELKSWMVDHLIEKSTHPELKYEKDNLFLVTFEQHQKKTNGFPDIIHQQAIENAKKRFNII